MFDLIVTPITNQSLVMMKLYALLKPQISDNHDEKMYLINNGSTDGLSQRSFHTHNKIRYLGSKHKTKDVILLNHALMKEPPEYSINTHVLIITPNTEIPDNYFELVRSAIISNPDADVILGRVDQRIKNKVKEDVRVKKYKEFTSERNSGALLKNFPPVREKALKTDEKATEPHISAHPDENKTETEIGTQKVSADFSSRLEEPSNAQLTKGAESILSENAREQKTGDNLRQAHMVTDFVSAENCQDNIFNIKKVNIKKFYSVNNIIFKKEAIFKSGLLDINHSYPQSAELLIYKLIMLQNANVIYDEDFPVVQTGKIRKHRSDEQAINNILNFDFIYKDYINKNVWRINKIAPHGVDQSVEGEDSRATSINALVILGSQHNEKLTKLVKQQLSHADKLVVTELPDNCSKKIQEIIASNFGEQFDLVVIVNPNTRFKYPYFIDDFKRYSCQLDYDGVLVSERDFDIREITPGLAAQGDVSACFNKWSVFAPDVMEAVTLTDFLTKCSEMIDATGRGLVSAFLPKPIKRVGVVSELGEGGEVTPAIDVKHKSSWYDWME